MAEVYKMQHAMHCASLAIADKKMQEVWDHCSALVHRVIKELLPWVPVLSKEDMRRQIVDNWKATYGDPNDPQVQERIQETAMALIRDANVAIRRAMNS